MFNDYRPSDNACSSIKALIIKSKLNNLISRNLPHHANYDVIGSDKYYKYMGG